MLDAFSSRSLHPPADLASCLLSVSRLATETYAGPDRRNSVLALTLSAQLHIVPAGASASECTHCTHMRGMSWRTPYVTSPRLAMRAAIHDTRCLRASVPWHCLARRSRDASYRRRHRCRASTAQAIVRTLKCNVPWPPSVPLLVSSRLVSPLLCSSHLSAQPWSCCSALDLQSPHPLPTSTSPLCRE